MARFFLQMFLIACCFCFVDAFFESHGNALLASPRQIEVDAGDMGTDSQKAISLFREGLNLYKKKKYSASVAKLKLAMKEEPEFQLGLYWLGLNSTDQKKFDKEKEYYEKLYQLGLANPKNVVAVDGCINAGLAFARRGQFSESEIWFSRAILMDPGDQYGMGWKAYRNLAITKFNLKEFGSATVCALLGHRLNSKRIPESMVNDMRKRATSEVATVIRDDQPPVKFDYLDDLGETGEPNTLDVAGEVTQLVDLYTVSKMLVMFKDQKCIQLVDYSDGFQVEQIDFKGKPQGASFIGGRLFLTVTGPDRLVEFDIQKQEERESWRLKNPAPVHFAVAPKHGLAFFSATSIQVLNLKTGKFSKGPPGVTSIRSDPKQRFVYGYSTPRYRPNNSSGMFLVRGRPIHYTIIGKSGDQQSVMYRFAIAQGGLVLSQLRLNAASNGKKMVVSDDGNVVAMVGGGGWRPASDVQNKGYGVTFFDAQDFERVLRFVATGAYPTGAAIDPVNQRIIARGEETYRSHILNDDTKKLGLIAGRDEELFRYSGDGKWLFATNKSQLQVVELDAGNGGQKTRWFDSLLDSDR